MDSPVPDHLPSHGEEEAEVDCSVGAAVGGEVQAERVNNNTTEDNAVNTGDVCFMEIRILHLLLQRVDN